MCDRRAVFRVAVPLVLATALATVWFVRAPKVSASLYGLIGRDAERIPKFIREASSSEISAIVSSPDAAKAGAVADELSKGPGAGPPDLPAGALDFIRENRGGLVTREAAALLGSEEGRRTLAKRALRRLYLSPIPPILGFEDDPFGLADAFLASLSKSGGAGSGRRRPNGCPVLETNGVSRILVKVRLGEESLDGTIASVAALREAAERLSSPAVEVRLAGPPVHAALAASKSKREVGVLTWFSLAFIAALSLVVFRSWKWIPLLASSLAVSALAGGLALAVFFDELHVMTFVMGTTVLGLVVDYSFHWLLSPAADRPSVRGNLFVSFLTTEIGLAPLTFATIPILRQSSLFLGVGLAAAFAYVLACYPAEGCASCAAEGARRSPSPAFRKRRGVCAAALGLVLLLSFAGLFRARIRTDVSALYRPPAELLEAERRCAAFGEFDFSKIPPYDGRVAIAENVRALYAEHGGEMAKALGVASLVPPPPPTDAFERPRTLMEGVLAAWTDEALKRLGVSVVALLSALLILRRRSAFGILLPPVASLLAVVGLLGWSETPVNLFHLLAMFLLLGMGIDYAVFLRSGNAAIRPALCSLLTSMAGFGALAFVSFPVVASFGVVLGAGLPLAFLLACPSRAPDAVEKAATPTGLEILWTVYRLFGLRVLHALAAAVGLCVWTFSPAVRRASPSARKILLFAQSLADKIVVMAEGRRLPQVATDGSEDADAFLDDVRTGRGVFILSSHVGTIEALAALGACVRTFHAWMDFDRTGVFNRFYLRHARRRRVVLHPISTFGMETVFEAGDLIDGGDCLVMAGDRGEGAFRFAAAFGHPVYFVACIAEGGCRYRAVVRRLPSDRLKMREAYGEILRGLASAFPDQHFVWSGADMV